MPAATGRQYRHLPAFILLLLAEKPMHGGAVHTALTESLQDPNVDTAAVYRALQTMEREGEITAVWDTSGSGPARKVYHLTGAGWDRLDLWKADIERRARLLASFLTAYERLDRAAE